MSVTFDEFKNLDGDERKKAFDEMFKVFLNNYVSDTEKSENVLNDIGKTKEDVETTIDKIMSGIFEDKEKSIEAKMKEKDKEYKSSNLGLINYYFYCQFLENDILKCMKRIQISPEHREKFQGLMEDITPEIKVLYERVSSNIKTDIENNNIPQDSVSAEDLFDTYLESEIKLMTKEKCAQEKEDLPSDDCIKAFMLASIYAEKAKLRNNDMKNLSHTARFIDIVYNKLIRKNTGNIFFYNGNENADQIKKLTNVSKTVQNKNILYKILFHEFFVAIKHAMEIDIFYEQNKQKNGGLVIMISNFVRYIITSLWKTLTGQKMKEEVMNFMVDEFTLVSGNKSYATELRKWILKTNNKDGKFNILDSDIWNYFIFHYNYVDLCKYHELVELITRTRDNIELLKQVHKDLFESCYNHFREIILEDFMKDNGGNATVKLPTFNEVSEYYIDFRLKKQDDHTPFAPGIYLKNIPYNKDHNVFKEIQQQKPFYGHSKENYQTRYKSFADFMTAIITHCYIIFEKRIFELRDALHAFSASEITTTTEKKLKEYGYES